MTDKTPVSANPTLVEFPRDPHMFSTQLRNAGLSAAGRVNGHRDKLKVLIDTLDVLKAHAVARYRAQVEAAKADAEREAAKAARLVSEAEDMRAAAVAKLEAELSVLKGAADE